MIAKTTKRKNAVALSRTITEIIQGSDEIASATFNVSYDYAEISSVHEGRIERMPTGWMNVDIKIRCKTLANKKPKKGKVQHGRKTSI